MSRPLEGIRVLDLSRILAGPWATQLLADFGADVIKVERRGSGDDTRTWGPPYLDRQGASTSAYFLSANRAKRSLAIDFTTQAGTSILRKLAERVDVVIENYRVGGLAAYGLDWPSLKAVNGKLIYCSITGYGQEGPYAHWPGYDFILQGVGGFMSITGAPDDLGGVPTKAGVAIVDIMTGLYASNAVMAALRHRDETGCGQYIDLALLDVQIATLANQAMNYMVSGKSPKRLGNAHPNIMPYESFETEDQKINIAVGNDAQFKTFCKILSIDSLLLDSRFKTNASRVRHRNVLAPLLQAELRKHPSEPLVRRLNEAGVPAGLVNNLDDVFQDPQVKHRKMERTIFHSVAGAIPSIACPVRFSDSPVTYELAPPMLGEHTEEILRDELGMTSAEIAQLRADGTI